MKQTSLKRFFNEIHEGQILFHHKTDFWALGSKIIAWFGQFGNATMPKKSHTSQICEISKKETIWGTDVCFFLFESTVKRGVNIHPTVRCVRRWKDAKGNLTNKYELFGFSKNEFLYWADFETTGQQKEKFRNFVKTVTNGEYKYTHITKLRRTYFYKTLRLIARFFQINIANIGLEIKTLEEKKEEGFYCSELNCRALYESGVITKEKYERNPYPAPMGLAGLIIKEGYQVLRIK